MDVNNIVENIEVVGADALLVGNAETGIEEETRSEVDSSSSVDGASGSDGEDDTDNSTVDDNSGNAEFPTRTQGSTKVKKDARGKKRRKPSNKRRNIRKVLRLDQLDQKTVEAQKEEQERLRRLELQKSLSGKFAESFLETQLESSKIKSDAKPIMILDDDNAELEGQEDSVQEPVILISSSDSEHDETYEDADTGDDSDSADDCRSLISTTNFRNEDGKILVNVGHAECEPDIFLPTHISKVIKPHQILGIRFLFDNLIESIKDFKANRGLGCILAHAMGLGKTVQSISLVHTFLTYTEAKKVLILVPINTLQNWLNEFNMWVPELPGSDSNSTKSHNRDCVMENGPSTFSDAPTTMDTENHESIFNASMEVLKNGYTDENTHGDGNSISAEGKAAFNQNLNQIEVKDVNSESQVPGHCSCKQENADGRNYKVFIINDVQKNTVARSKVIDEWHQVGGVLIMGYEMFRMMAMYTPSLCNSVTNSKGKKKKQAKKSAAVIDIEEEEREMKLLLGMQGALCNPGPDLVVCDEGHRIKNQQSNIHHALHKIQTRKRLVLTGYPLQNNLTEYWCMVDFVRPNYLGSRQEFQNMFERPIMNGQCIDSTIADKRLMKYRAHVLSSLLKGFVQRSDYTALKVALPPKQEHVIMVRLSPVQQGVYQRFISRMQEGYSDQLNPIKIFAVCSKIWNHPDILFKAMKADMSKRDVLFETDEDSLTEDGAKSSRNAKVTQNSPLTIGEESQSSFGADTRSLLSKITDWAKEIFDSHQYTVGQAEMSGKFIVLMEIINESLARGDKLLVFSQSLLTLDLLEEFLGRIPVQQSMEVGASSGDGRTWTKNTDYFRIDGNTSSSERERLIDMFNNKDNSTAKLFLLSTRAGCLGINLVGANRVVVFDVSWNPCHDAQAVCRVYRYGQEKPCFIYRLIASNTMEKRMYYRQISKQGVSDRVIDELNPIENFTKDELHKLLATTWDNEPPVDYTEEANLFNDPVLKRLLHSCHQWIVQLPFKHESLLQDESSSKLSNKEKREAKRGYEEEKRKVSNVMNGPFLNRFPPYQQGGPLHMAATPQSMLNSYSLLSGNSLASQHPLLPHVNAMNLQTNIALVNILRRAELLRQHRLNSPHNESVFRDGLSAASNSHKAPPPALLHSAGSNFAPSAGFSDIDPSLYPAQALPVLQNIMAPTETMSVAPSQPDESSNQSAAEQSGPNDQNSSQVSGGVPRGPNDVVVICIDSDDDE